MDNVTVNTNEAKPAARAEATLLPPVDVIEDAQGITLYADLPGVPKDKVTLHVEDDTLSIEGEVALSVPEGMQASHAEVQLPRYRRVFQRSTACSSCASPRRSTRSRRRSRSGSPDASLPRSRRGRRSGSARGTAPAPGRRPRRWSLSRPRGPGAAA